jgi:hypothetical protein
MKSPSDPAGVILSQAASVTAREIGHKQKHKAAILRRTANFILGFGEKSARNRLATVTKLKTSKQFGTNVKPQSFFVGCVVRWRLPLPSFTLSQACRH